MPQSALHFIYFLAAIGAIGILELLYYLLSNLIRTILPRKDFASIYGANSWAVVTGASDGIGLSFCKELAKQGFNICLIARNLQKLSTAENEIRDIYRSVDTKIITADFANSQKQGFFEAIVTQLRTIDVSILVNNVGICLQEEMYRIPQNKLKQEININCVPQACLTALLTPGMLNRVHRSAVINIESALGASTSPYFANYSGIKAYGTMLSKGFQYQVSQKIDVLCVQPMVVQTKLSGQSNRFDVITPEQCASGSLDRLGRDVVTNGHWKHRLLSEIARKLPESLFVSFFARQSKSMLDQNRLQQQKH